MLFETCFGLSQTSKATLTPRRDLKGCFSSSWESNYRGRTRQTTFSGACPRLLAITSTKGICCEETMQNSSGPWSHHYLLAQ